MAIAINTSFSVGAGVPIDERLTLTKSEMLNINEATMPSVYMCVCKDDGFIYTFDKNNTIDLLTGKFRKSSGNIYTTTLVGDGINKDFTLNHNLDKINIIVSVEDLDGVCLVDYKVIDKDNVKLSFDDPPLPIDSYKITIM